MQDSSSNKITLQNSHDLFIISILLILDIIIKEMPDSQIKENANKFLNAIEKSELNTDKISNMIKKVFTTISANVNYLKNKNPKLFYLRGKSNDKNVIITIIPGIDLGEVYKVIKSNESLESSLWKYIKTIYLSSINMISHVNETIIEGPIRTIQNELNNEINYNDIINDFYKNFPTSNLIPKKGLNPFIGISPNGTSNDIGVNDMINLSKIDGTESKDNDLNLSLLKKIINFDEEKMNELKNQLKNINPKDIDDASNNIKRLLGDNIDDETTLMINTMFHKITNKLKSDDISDGDPISKVVKIAQTVATEMIPTIDKKKFDMKKIWNTTQNLATNCVDSNGTKIFGDNNPFSMLMNLMENKVNQESGDVPTNEKDLEQNKCLEEYKNIINNMNIPSQVESTNQNKDKDKKRKKHKN